MFMSAPPRPDSALSASTLMSSAPHLRTPPTVAFVCTHNAARSQMAEGYLRHHCGRWYTTCSAGAAVGGDASSGASSDPTSTRNATRDRALPAHRSSGPHPLAVHVMSEIGVDISEQTRTPLHTLHSRRTDYVVTLSEMARAACPLHLAAIMLIHQRVPDPVAVQGPRSARLDAFREARDRIARWIDGLFGRARFQLRDR